MPRLRAGDYADKKKMILDAAAGLFAERGYAGCKMEEIAERCQVSKSMLYHYFEKKEDVLFEILQIHVGNLNQTLDAYIDSADPSDKAEYFRGFVEIYLEKSSNARARHVVALHDMRYLTDDQKVAQEGLERTLIELIVKLLRKINIDLQLAEYKVYTLLLIGMMNWIELWYSRSGKVSPSELYKRVSTLFLKGFLVTYGKGSDAAKVRPAATSVSTQPPRRKAATGAR